MVGPSIIGVHHVKFPVSNLEQSRTWYQRVLGLRVLVDFPDDDGVWCEAWPAFCRARLL